MEPAIFARGFVLGFSIAAVVGPIALLCIRRTLASGFTIGFVSGLGAATADATYGAIASLGFTALTSLLVGQNLWFKLAGGAFLVYLGLTAIKATPGSRAARSPINGLQVAGAYSSTLALTLSNPMTIMSFAAMFATIGTGSLGLVAGVFIGSAAWWLVLSSVVSRLRARVTPSHLRLVNIASGALITAFGVQSIASGLLQR